jgi:hypothetical protein
MDTCGTSAAAQVCATPNAALPEGGHTWKARAVDKAGNAVDSSETWKVYVDFSPPAPFALVSPGTDTGASTTLAGPHADV